MHLRDPQKRGTNTKVLREYVAKVYYRSFHVFFFEIKPLVAVLRPRNVNARFQLLRLDKNSQQIDPNRNVRGGPVFLCSRAVVFMTLCVDSIRSEQRVPPHHVYMTNREHHTQRSKAFSSPKLSGKDPLKRVNSIYFSTKGKMKTVSKAREQCLRSSYNSSFLVHIVVCFPTVSFSLPRILLLVQLTTRIIASQSFLLFFSFVSFTCTPTVPGQFFLIQDHVV